MTQRLVEAAMWRSVTVSCGFLLPQNLRMLNLLRALGLAQTVYVEDDVKRIAVDHRC